MIDKICVVLAEKKYLNMIVSIKKAREQGCSFVEIRLDCLDEILSGRMLKDLQNNLRGIRHIITVRRKDEGGRWRFGEINRLDYLKKILNVGYEFVDIELKTFQEGKLNVEEIHKKTSLICSFHDFVKTPQTDLLKKILNEMDKFAVEAKKIAVFARNYKDTKRLLDILVQRRNDEKLIVLGMGGYGQLLRIVSPFLGGFITYASLRDYRTAPGQMSFSKMRGIFSTVYS